MLLIVCCQSQNVPHVECKTKAVVGMDEFRILLWGLVEGIVSVLSKKGKNCLIVQSLL